MKSDNLKVAIRVDVSNQIGLGHFMRCLTLADFLAEEGALVCIIARHLPLYLREMLTSKGFELRLLSSQNSPGRIDELRHAEWLGTSQYLDAQETISVLAGETWHWLIVDHYALDARWEVMLRDSTEKLMVIDDIADRQHNCDLLLDQNLYTDMTSRYIGKVPTTCKLLLGPNYALLREEFHEARSWVKPRLGVVKRVLIFFGGVDSENCTGKAIEAISEITDYKFDVDVAIGIQHPHKEEIQSMCASYGYACHIQTNKMATLMANADLSIGACGSATWERCCMGLPTLVIALAFNQIQSAQTVSSLNAIKYLGEYNKIRKCEIQHEIIKSINSEWISESSRIAMELVDGEGVLRTAKEMGI